MASHNLVVVTWLHHRIPHHQLVGLALVPDREPVTLCEGSMSTERLQEHLRVQTESKTFQSIQKCLRFNSILIHF